MKTKKINRILLCILTAFLALFFVFESALSIKTKAENILDFEKQNVLNDLEESLLNGETFSLKDYNFDESKTTKVLSFLEYGYTFYENLQDNFGLYVYVYNPQGLEFEISSSLHSISFRVGEDDNLNYSKYPLSVLDFSRGDYYGLFYKLKVELNDTQKKDILDRLNSTERIYAVSEIELKEKTKVNATSISAQSVYKYSGYMSGFGADSSAENTLECKSEFLETVSLDVHPTVYRPEGTNGKNDYTQDSLHSVYFAVPNKYITQFGEISAVHATWLDAVLKPALVTGNQEAFSAINNFLGVQVSPSSVIPGTDGGGSGIGGGGGGGRSISTIAEASTDTLEYMYLGACEMVDVSGMGTLYNYNCGYRYNVPTSWTGELGGVCSANPIYYGSEVNPLYLLFNAGAGVDSADNCAVPSEEVFTKLRGSASKYGGELVNGKYAACVFESVANEFTEVNIRREVEYDLTSETITQNWWQKLWGTGTVVSSTFDGIKAIYKVSDSDFTGAIYSDCNNLYIGRQDYEAFKKFYEDNKTSSTIYLFRYQISDYIAQEATLFESGSFLGLENREEVDTNAYFFQETVNLDFDIIDITVSTGEKETVIPVVMNPIDIVPGPTPPVNTESDAKVIPVFLFLVALVILVLLSVSLFPILKPIFSVVFTMFKWIIKALWWIIAFPFNLLGKRKKKQDSAPDGRSNAPPHPQNPEKQKKK